ncbi:MAG TPA: GGDEF domain-containing protein, partial [Plasticicumulans sp.]|nr:GGDEF domain-containing protein [Plasticicumulans sp.]
MFDVKTLMFFMALSALLMAGVITLADQGRAPQRSLSGLQLWTLSLLVQAAGWFVLVASNSLIPAGFAGPLALGCVSLCWGLRLQALDRCAGRDGMHWRAPVLVGVSVGISLLSPASEWLVGLHSLLYGLLACACARQVRRLPDHGHVTAQSIMALALLLLGGVLIARSAELLLARALWRQVEIWRTVLEQASFLSGYASTIIVTIGLVLLARAGHEEHLQRLAGTDALTGLLNRRSFLSRAGQALRPQTPAAVLMLDLDHFKIINDSFGHPVGDAVLRTVSATLASGLRREDLLAAPLELPVQRLAELDAELVDLHSGVGNLAEPEQHAAQVALQRPEGALESSERLVARGGTLSGLRRALWVRHSGSYPGTRDGRTAAALADTGDVVSSRRAWKERLYALQGAT